jgi:hypothetical protein
MKRIYAIIILTALFCPLSAMAARFEELDKPPEGAHEGQMFLSAFVSMGYPMGPVFSEEQGFMKNTIYYFSDSDIYKRVWITHTAFSMGLSFEYMPIDHVGIKTRLRRFIVVQRTLFGSEFRNWSENLYSEYSFLVGPAFHLTNRKQWDITFTPLAGYALAKFNPTPVAKKLKSGDGYTSQAESGSANNFTAGAELNVSVYFSGGLFVSLGLDWNMTFLKPGSGCNASYTDENGVTHTYNAGSSTFNTYSLIFSAGYAFYN